MIEIPLTQGKVALIDDEDAHLAQFKWYAHREWKRYYALRFKDRKQFMLHREVMRAPPGTFVDHVNGDGLDCRRANLRFASPAQNTFNSQRPKNNVSGFKGVQANKQVGKWVARIKANGRVRQLGCFDDPVKAARAYDEAARLYFGEFAWLNFPDRKAG